MGGNKPDYLSSEGPSIVETDEQFKLRVISFRQLLDELGKQYHSILVISHGLFMCELLNLSSVYNCQYVKYN